MCFEGLYPFGRMRLFWTRIGLPVLLIGSEPLVLVWMAWPVRMQFARLTAPVAALETEVPETETKLQFATKTEAAERI